VGAILIVNLTLRICGVRVNFGFSDDLATKWKWRKLYDQDDFVM